MAKKKRKTKTQKKKSQTRKKKQSKKDKEKAKQERIKKAKIKKRNKRLKIGCSFLAGLSVLAAGVYVLIKKPANSSYDENNTVQTREDPKYLKLSKLEKAALSAAERISGNLAENQDYKFYENSKNIVLYLPDTHDDFYQEKQKKRIILLDKELKNRGIKISGLGLEGFVQGVHSKEKIEKAFDKEEILGDRITRKFQTKADRIWNNFDKKFKEVLVDKLEDYIAVKIAKKTYTFFQKIFYDLYDLQRRLENKYRWEKNGLFYPGAPGEDYLNVIDTSFFGLEDESIVNSLEISMKSSFLSAVLKFFDIQSAMNKFYKKIPGFFVEKLYYIFQDFYQKELGEVTEDLAIFEKKLPSEWLEKTKKIIKKNPKNVTAEMAEECMPRTDYWINAIPEDMKDIVVIIGGNAHKEWYKDLADKEKLSYIILPKLK